MVLDSTLKKLQIVLSGAITTNQLPYVVSYFDITQSTMSASDLIEGDGTSNSTTAVDVVGAPLSGIRRQIKELIINNADTASATLKVRYNNNGTARDIYIATLSVGDQLVYTDRTGFQVVNSLGQIKYSGAAQGTTPAVILGSAAAAGVASTFLRTDDTIRAFDGSTPAAVAAAAAVGTSAFTLRADHVHTIGLSVVSRTMLDSTGKNWQFLGQGTASAAVRTGTITWTGTYKQLMFEYFIAGYSGGAIGRLIVGPTAGLSESGTTFCTNLIEGVTQNTTSVSVPGWPLAVTAAAVPRYGWMFVSNVATVVKRMTGHGLHSGTAPTTVPTAMKMDGLFNDTTNLINKAELAVYAAITGTAISSTTFNAGTYLNVWGRNDD